MATQMIGRQRHASPERWRKAVERAISEGVQVRQLAGSGAWIATSGSDATTAYEIEVTGEIAHGCNCLAGLNGDPVCKHRAAFYLAVGLLDPEPEPPALPPCGYCSGRGWETVIGKSGAAFRFACQVCEGTGAVEVEAGDETEPAPTAPAPLPCPGCAGTGSQRLRVVSPMVAGGVVPIRCGRCRGTGKTEEVSAPIAA